MKEEHALKDFIGYNDDIEHYDYKVAVADLGTMHREKNEEHILPMRLLARSAFLVTEGELDITVDYIPYRLKKNMLAILLDRHLINHVCPSADCQGYHLLVGDNQFEALLGEEAPPLIDLTDTWLTPVLEFKEPDFLLLRNIVERIRFNINRHNHAFKTGLIKNELRNFMYELWNLAIRNRIERRKIETRSPYEGLVMRFMELLRQNYRKQHEVAYYAAGLCVPAVYLTRAIKHVTGLTAVKWISEVITTESKILLRRPNISIKEVAEELNFSDQASFSKFFKKNTGKSPSEYRKEALL